MSSCRICRLLNALYPTDGYPINDEEYFANSSDGIWAACEEHYRAISAFKWAKYMEAWKEE